MLLYNFTRWHTECKTELMTSLEHMNTAAQTSAKSLHTISWNMAPSASGTTVLTLGGYLKPGWLGKLSSYLAHNKINLVSGTAHKSSSIRWNASFEIESKGGRVEPFDGFDPLPALMSADTPIETAQLTLSDFHSEFSAKHGGSIQVKISGNDCIGFLYNILKIFSFSSLFPTELEIATQGRTAHDSFWLKGIGAAVPTDGDLQSLNERLNSIMDQTIKIRKS